VSSLHQGFQQAGQSDGSEAVFRWLDGADESPLIQQVKRRMLDICPVAAGDQVLDVGCGLGHEVRRLAQQVGPQGRVVGIDANSAMITEARRRERAWPSPSALKSATPTRSGSRTAVSICAGPSVSCATWTGQRSCWQRWCA
jgi:SAM-dependent methyltransferase